MKQIFFLFAIIIYSTHIFAQSNKESKINTEIIQQFFAALNNHDTLALVKFCDDSVHIESPNWEGIETGKPALAHAYARYFKTDPYLKYTITNIVATNNATVVEYTSGGQMTNLEANIPEYMRGRKYILKNCTRFNFANSKITGIVTYFDQVSFLKQMGFFDQKN